MAFHIVRSLSCLMNSGERLESINRIKKRKPLSEAGTEVAKDSCRRPPSPASAPHNVRVKLHSAALSQALIRQDLFNPSASLDVSGQRRFFVRTPRLTRYQHFNVMGNTMTLFRASITHPEKISVPPGADLH